MKPVPADHFLPIANMDSWKSTLPMLYSVNAKPGMVAWYQLEEPLKAHRKVIGVPDINFYIHEGDEKKRLWSIKSGYPWRQE